MHQHQHPPEAENHGQSDDELVRNNAPSFVVAASWCLRRSGWIRGRSMGDRPIDIVEALHACYRRCDLVLRSVRRGGDKPPATELTRCHHCRPTLTDNSASPQSSSYRNRPPQSLTACGSRRWHHCLATTSSPPRPYDAFILIPFIPRYPTLLHTSEHTMSADPQTC